MDERSRCTGSGIDPTPSWKEEPDAKRLHSLPGLSLVRVTSNIYWLVVHCY